MELKVTGVNQAVAEGFQYLSVAGESETSRNGEVIVAPEPLLTVYSFPTERLLFSPLRDANPFFHLMEALAFLAAKNEVDWYAYFAANMRNYSDDGKTFYGSYGHRWRKWFGYDQLAAIASELKTNLDSRRCVLSMWDGGEYSNPALR